MATHNGKLLFVSGLSGSGKTTLGELLKKEDQFVHFNVDVWAFGGNPVEESAAVPGPAMMANRDPDVKAAFDNMIANGFSKLAQGQSVEWAVWENFFSKLCPAINAARETIGEKSMVVTFSVYLRSVRDYLRQNLGAPGELAFVVLNPSVESVGARKVQHLKNTAEERGQTLSQFLRSFNPSSDAPDMEEDVLVGLLTAQAKSGAVGFEAGAADEPRTTTVGDMPLADVHNAVRTFISTL
jgi:gluconate kinase